MITSKEILNQLQIWLQAVIYSLKLKLPSASDS